MLTKVPYQNSFYTCIDIDKSNGLYTLHDVYCGEYKKGTQEIIRMINNPDVTITNLTIDKANGVPYLDPTPNIAMDKILGLSKIWDAKVIDIFKLIKYTKLREQNRHNLNKVFIVKHNRTDSTLCIKNNIAWLPNLNQFLDNTGTSVKELIGENLTVLGGSSLLDISQMFADISLNKLDLSDFNTSNVLAMSNLFSSAKIQHLDIRNFSTKNVRVAQSMFENFETTILDLSRLDLTNVVNNTDMTLNCKAQQIIL